MTLVRFLRSSLLLAGWLAACHGTPTAPAPVGSSGPATSSVAPIAPVAAASPHPTSAPDATTLRGTLRFREIPPAKSVAAYDGIEFTLVTSSGEVFPLTPGLVSREQLKALDGKAVTVRGRLMQPPPASAFEQAPVGPDGKPLPRSARHEVLAITAD